MCMKLFSDYCFGMVSKNKHLTRFCNHEAIAGLIEHVPQLMVLPNAFDDDTGATQTLAVSILINEAFRIVNYSTGAFTFGVDDVKAAHDTIEQIMCLPTSCGPAFDMELEFACNDVDKRHGGLTAQKVKDVLILYKQQAERWRHRVSWISACVQIGLQNDTKPCVSRKRRV